MAPSSADGLWQWRHLMYLIFYSTSARSQWTMARTTLNPAYPYFEHDIFLTYIPNAIPTTTTTTRKRITNTPTPDTASRPSTA